MRISLLLITFFMAQLHACQIPSDPYQLEYSLKICQLIKNLKNSTNEKNTLLLYGPTGTGKNTLAHLIAQETNSEVVEINSASLINQTSGNVTKKIESRIEEANKKEHRTIFIFRDIDAIAHPTTKENQMQEQRISTNQSLMHSMIQSNPNVFFIFITRHKENLDPAFLRRVDTIVEVQEPNLNRRRHIIKMLLMKDGIYNDYHEKKLDNYAQQTQNFDIRALERIFRHCKQQAMYDKATPDCIENEIKEIKEQYIDESDPTILNATKKEIMLSASKGAGAAVVTSMVAGGILIARIAYRIFSAGGGEDSED